LESESSFHSFVIDHLEPVLDSLSDDDDKSALQAIITESDSKKNDFELPKWMAHEMNRFKRDPEALSGVLSEGWAGLDTEAIHQGVELKVLQSFRSSIYPSFLHLYTIYSYHNFDLSSTFYEGFYRTLIWGFLHILIFDKKLTYDTGEVTSTASSDRKNVKRHSTSKTKQQGRKIDGIIYSRANKKELCAIEFGRSDDCQTGTKVLKDGKKLAKVLKDMFDAILSKSEKPVDTQKELRTFGMLISGLRIDPVLLQQYTFPACLNRTSTQHLPPNHRHLRRDMSTVTKVDWEDPRDFTFLDGFGSIDSRFYSIVRALEYVEQGVKDMERAESLPTIYNRTTMKTAFCEEFEKAREEVLSTYHIKGIFFAAKGIFFAAKGIFFAAKGIFFAAKRSIYRLWDVLKNYLTYYARSPPRYRYQLTSKFRDDGDVVTFTYDWRKGSAAERSINKRCDTPNIYFTHARSPPRYRYRLTRRFRDDGDVIKFTNDTDTEVCIICTQDLVTVLKAGNIEACGGTGGLNVRVGVVNQLVQTKQIKSVLKLAPKQAQDVLIAPKYVLVSAFAVYGESMRLLYHEVLLKKGYNHTVEQKDIGNSLKAYTSDEFFQRFLQ
ncbi:hypothetical protein BGX27_001941, partial [Mortierella sp. AM989]